MSEYIIGVDIGGMSMKCGIFTMDGDVLHKFVIKTNVENNGENIIKDMVSGIDKFLSENDINKKTIYGIGITVPGQVMNEKIVLRCVNLFWTKERNLQDEVWSILSDEYDKINIIIKVGNDANLAALGETWMGSGDNAKNAVMITLGTGVGGGIVINGNVLEGSMSVGGEIGHMHVSEDIDYDCNCGSRGCLEQFCAAPGIVRRTLKMLDVKKDDSALRIIKKEDITVKDIFDAAKNGDVIASEIVEEMSKYLGTAIASLTNVIDPEVFLIGGGISKAGDFLLNKIIFYRDKISKLRKGNVPIKLAILGNDAGMYGAVKLVLS